MMTVEQVLIETQKLLREINVPVGLKEQIADPISGAINNLQLCLDAFEEQKTAQAEEMPEEEEEEPVFADEVGGEENG